LRVARDPLEDLDHFEDANFEVEFLANLTLESFGQGLPQFEHTSRQRPKAL
jgi:hypothetical protein